MEEGILIVEDDESILDLIEIYLKKEDFQVLKSTRGDQALELIEKNSISLLILDIMLPDTDGFSLCVKIREKHNFPIIMLTAKDDEFSRVMGLTLGADDYVVKPFLPMELVARVKSQLRRYTNYNREEKEDILKYGDLELNKKTREVMVKGEKVDFTPTEYTILKALMDRMGEVLSSDDLFKEIYPDEEGIDYYDTLSVHIRHIRVKLGGLGKMIKTVWGVGYKIG